MSGTPVKSVSQTSVQFFPKEITTPNKDYPEISKTVFTHISRLHGLLTDWLRVREKGTRICKGISVLKLHEYQDDYFPQSLTPLTESLLTALKSLKHVVEGVETINNQLQSLAKLQPGNQPVILTWSASQISENISEILSSLDKEYRLKEAITENIAHCRDENLMEVYVSSWEFDVYLHADSYIYLFAEVGLSGLT